MNDEWEEVSHRHAGRWMLGALVAFVAATLLFGLWSDEEDAKPPESAAESASQRPLELVEFDRRLSELDRRLTESEAKQAEAEAYLRKHMDTP